ncbi:MAG: hypothetical protein ACREV4_12905 [Gammaproteobacteria bacterium]
MSFDSFRESPLGAFMQSPLGERSIMLAAQKHIGTTSDEADDFMFMDADSSGLYFYMGLAPTGTEYEVAFLSPDGETLRSVRKITPLVFQVPMGFAATSSYVILFGRVNPGMLPQRFAVWRMTKDTFDLRYREYSDSVSDAPRRAVRLSNNQILMAFADRLLWLNDDLSVDTLNAYSGAGTIYDLIYDGSDIFIGGIRSLSPTNSFYAKIDSSKSVVYSRQITLTPQGGNTFAMDVSANRLVYMRDAKDLVCIDPTTHTVLWAKRITTNYTINDVLIDGARVVCVGFRGTNAGMFVLIIDLETGALSKKNRLNTSGELTHVIKSGGQTYIAGHQATQTYGSGDGQLFLRPEEYTDSPIHQVSTVSILNFSAASTYNVTIGGVTVSQVGTVDSNTTAANLQGALAASLDPNFTAITWTVAANVITGTAKAGDVPFTITTSVTGGTGTMSTQTTMSVVSMSDVSPTISSFTITKSAQTVTVHDTVDSTSATAAHSMDDTTFLL